MPKRRTDTTSTSSAVDARVKLHDSAAATPTVLIDRKVDVPNGFWDDEYDDGEYTRGTVVKAGRQNGSVIYQIRFGTQGEWSTPPAWMRLKTLVGLEPVTETCDMTCNLLDREPPAKAPRGTGKQKASSGSGATAKGRGKKAPPGEEDGDEADLSELE